MRNSGPSECRTPEAHLNNFNDDDNGHAEGDSNDYDGDDDNDEQKKLQHLSWLLESRSLARSLAGRQAAGCVVRQATPLSHAPVGPLCRIPVRLRSVRFGFALLCAGKRLYCGSLR